MARKRLIAVAALAIIGFLLIVALSLYLASRYEPSFYREALVADSASQDQLSNELVRRVMALQNGLKREGPWHAAFSAKQINAWLRYDLERNYPEVLQSGFSDPCVAVEPDRLLLACRHDNGLTKSVLCLTVEIYAPEPNVIALRIVKARAGMLPLPLGSVLKSISDAAQNARCQLRWGQADNDPVALLTLPSPSEKGDLAIKIDSVQLGGGEISISGNTTRNK
jgi:hypothetical protein